MGYSWERYVRRKYGKTILWGLKKQQKEYERRKEAEGNECIYCGKYNEGSIVETNKGEVMLLYYGKWVGEHCAECGRKREYINTSIGRG